MNHNNVSRTLFIILVMSLTLLASAQEGSNDERTRDAFLVTRPKTASSKPTPVPTTKSTGKSSTAKSAAEVPLGLGYTLYQRDANDKAVRVDAAREFREGDAVRLMVEPNVNGYLYIFHAENGKDPQMIFPDARLNGGANRVTAHVPYEVPSRQEADPRFRWFYFDNQAATERLYVIVTRQPLAGVLTSKELITYCQANAQSCPWRPSATAWNQIAANADTPASVSQIIASGQAETAAEATAVSRGFGLSVSAPAPTVVKMNASPKAPMVMMTVELIHK